MGRTNASKDPDRPGPARSGPGSHAVLLPAGAPAEEVARQEDIWTYATVCAGLLHDLGKPVTDLRIIVDDEDWSPLAGPLPVGHPYRVTFQPDRRHRRHERVSPLLAPWLVPATGLSWLGREPEILFDILPINCKSRVI